MIYPHQQAVLEAMTNKNFFYIPARSQGKSLLQYSYILVEYYEVKRMFNYWKIKLLCPCFAWNEI